MCTRTEATRPVTGFRRPAGRVLRATARLLGAAAMAFGGGSCGSGERPQEPLPEPRPRPVKSVEVSAQGGARVLRFTGVAKAERSAGLAFRVSGRVHKLHVEQGEIVQEGALIAELDPVDLEIQVREIEASLSEAKAREVLATSEFQRIQGLYETDSVSQGDFESALAQRESARSRVESAQQRLELSKLQVGYATLRAPVACAIAEVKAEEGEFLQAGSPVVEMVTGRTPQVEISVPENLISQIRGGTAATVTFSAFPGRTFAGRVRNVGIVPSQGVATYPATIELQRTWRDESGASKGVPIAPGMTVEAEIESSSDDASSRLVVPLSAIASDREGTFAYIVEFGSDHLGFARRRSVETGRLVAGGIEVLTGLSSGNQVITAGVSRLQDGQKVRRIAPPQRQQ